MKNLFLSIVIACLLTGCLPSFQYPIVDKINDRLDQRLLGMWILDEKLNDLKKGEYGFIQFLPREHDLVITYYTMTEEGKAEAIHLVGIAAEVEGVGYVNYKFFGDEEKEVAYHLSKYELDEDKVLKITHVDQAVIQKAIEEQKLPGDILKDKWGTNVTIKAERAQLIGFFAHNQAFNEQDVSYYVFKDIGLPSSP